MLTVRAKMCEKRLKNAETKLLKIIHKIDLLKLNNSNVSKLELPANITLFSDLKQYAKHLKTFCFVISLVIFTTWIFNYFYTEAGVGYLISKFHRDCILQLPSSSKALFRPPEDCSMCMGVTNVTRLSETTAEEFEELFAYSTIPVIVTDATRNWKAMEEFSFKFFAEFYLNEKSGRRINDCFYFAYNSGLNSLQEVFTMDDDRANLSGDPWYVGWSTCYDEETRKLRGYYSRPYFLPKTAESDMVDWIFMGGPGQGAHMHVDSVRHISWQAQIRGRKEWQLAPPPECLYWCDWITFTVEPGEILVVDTNRWYHKTTVLPGDISITIGAEFD